MPKGAGRECTQEAIAIIGAVAVGVVGIAGTALGAGSGSSPSFLNDFARRLGVSPAKVRSAYQGAMADRLDQLVKDGKLTQAQANRLSSTSTITACAGSARAAPGSAAPVTTCSQVPAAIPTVVGR